MCVEHRQKNMAIQAGQQNRILIPICTKLVLTPVLVPLKLRNSVFSQSMS